jgi:hypothetical protein
MLQEIDKVDRFSTPQEVNLREVGMNQMKMRFVTKHRGKNDAIVFCRRVRDMELSDSNCMVCQEFGISNEFQIGPLLITVDMPPLET